MNCLSLSSLLKRVKYLSPDSTTPSLLHCKNLTSKPLEIKFAIQNIVNDQIQITIINSQEEKQKVLELFKKHNNLN